MIRAAWVLAGLYVAVLGAAVHRHSGQVFGIDLPWGLLVALVPLVPLAIVADQSTRLGSACVLIGWGLALMLQSMSVTADYLVANDPLGWTFSLGGLGCLVAVMTGNSRLFR